MRFITEFKELHPDSIHRKAQDVKIYAERDLGHLIAKIFGWQNPSASHHRLEIEAFPMDKWIEFKNRLFAHIDFCNEEDRPVDEIRVLNLIKELESFGKPSEVEKEMMNLKEPEYRGPSSHCKACEDEKAGIKHIQAQNHTCKK